LRHKIIAFTAALLIAAGLSALFLTRPRLYTTFAVLSCDPAAVKDETRPGVDALTARILTLQAIDASAVHLGLSPNPFLGVDASSLPGHLAISAIDTNTVRVAWTGYGAQNGLDAARALAYTLTSWAPQTPPRQQPQAAGWDQAREQSLLRLTLARIDSRTAALREELRRSNPKSPSRKGTEARQHASPAPVHGTAPGERDRAHRSALEAQIRQFQSQRRVVQQRLDEASLQNPPTKSSQPGAASGIQIASHPLPSSPAVAGSAAAPVPPTEAAKSAPFALMGIDAAEQPGKLPWLRLEALALSNGVAFALLYLAIALLLPPPAKSSGGTVAAIARDELSIATMAESRR